MQAVTIVDGSLEWTEHPDPVAGDHEIVVAVRSAGLNAADLMQRLGFYPAPAGVPADIPGLELAGEVVAVGAKTGRFAVGDRVMAVVGGGAQAEMAVVDERCALAVPDGLSWEEAGGFPEAFSTAHDAMFTQAALAMGDRVLVTAAAGGVGTAGVQLAAAAGAAVVASVRSAQRRAEVAALGAVAAVDPEEALTLGPFDVALELVGGSSLPGVLDALAVGGRIVVIGVSGGGGRTDLDLMALMHRRARISASTLRARPILDKASVARAVEAHVLPHLESGRLRVPVCATFPMDGAADAYEHFAAGGKFGKIVLVPPGRR
ncbi:MAG TPA: zinc-binding dehydrogenase [Acidimicrobiales bacterium]|jgi:NADPH:quinone reductase-like Zn-dependent oxidoreductase